MVLAVRVGGVYSICRCGQSPIIMGGRGSNDQNAPPIVVDVCLCFGCGILHPRSGIQLECCFQA